MTSASHRLTVQGAQSLPAVIDVVTAAAVLGIGRTAAYELIRTGDWPTPVVRLGKLIRIPTGQLLTDTFGHVPTAVPCSARSRATSHGPTRPRLESAAHRPPWAMPHTAQKGRNPGGAAICRSGWLPCNRASSTARRRNSRGFGLPSRPENAPARVPSAQLRGRETESGSRLLNAGKVSVGGVLTALTI